MKNIKLEQSDRYVAKFSPLRDTPSPQKGWVKYIRGCLGMTAEQLAKRLGVTRRNVVRIEQAELDGGITLKSLNDVASAMHCKVVYALVPETNLKDIIKAQARKYVMAQLESVSHNMLLEDQQVQDKQIIEAQIEKLVEEYLSKSLRTIWNE